MCFNTVVRQFENNLPLSSSRESQRAPLKSCYVDKPPTKERPRQYLTGVDILVEEGIGNRMNVPGMPDTAPVKGVIKLLLLPLHVKVDLQSNNACDDF